MKPARVSTSTPARLAPCRARAPRAWARSSALLALWLVVFAAVLAACEPGDQTPVGRGRRIFQRTCAGCHGVDGRGVRRLGLDEKPRDLTQPAFQAEADDARLLASIRLGKGQMPAFGNLMRPEDLSSLIAFIRSLNPERPRVPSAGPATAVGARASGPGPTAATPGAASTDSRPRAAGAGSP